MLARPAGEKRNIGNHPLGVRGYEMLKLLPTTMNPKALTRREDPSKKPT